MTTSNVDAFRLLVAKAQRGLEACQQQLVQARARREQLAASQARLSTLMIEYRRRQQDTLARGQLMADSLNQSRFIAQLQQLQDQAMRATSQADSQCAQLARAVVQAHLEVEKARKVLEQAQARERAHVARVEQRRQDDQAVMRFQWNHS